MESYLLQAELQEGKGRINQTEWYGLRSTRCPGKVNKLEPFEMDLIVLVKNVRFRKVTKPFQKKLQQNIKMIRTSDKAMTFSDKTNNMYRSSKNQYNILCTCSQGIPKIIYQVSWFMV